MESAPDPNDFVKTKKGGNEASSSEEEKIEHFNICAN